MYAPVGFMHRHRGHDWFRGLLSLKEGRACPVIPQRRPFPPLWDLRAKPGTMSLLLRFAGAWLRLFGAEHFEFPDTEIQNALRSPHKKGYGIFYPAAFRFHTIAQYSGIMTTGLAGDLTKPYKGIRPAARTRSVPPFAPPALPLLKAVASFYCRVGQASYLLNQNRICQTDS